ncbi:glycosyltransferase [Pseudarthrobacter sp. NIBRBAC000502772]|uniref:glycosyltransferase n=1 Tax=Pseudarthrobacter sp. NIBRBAC000502772 TaxID=2590775 RepID=UPI00352D2926
MNRMNNEHVIVYDPNWINPYGIELASIIAAAGYEVDLWCTENRSFTPEGVKLHPKLVGQRRHNSLLRLAVRRLIEPMRISTSAPRRSALIIVWTRNPWDALVFAIRALVGGKTIFIYHNPDTVRRRPGLPGVMERLLLRVSTLCVVHSSRLRASANASANTIRIAAHPPYSVTTRRPRRAAGTGNLKNAVPVVAFVGALRHDKGVNDLVGIAERVMRPFVLRILGPERIPASTSELLRATGATCEYVGSAGGPTDDELINGLESADVMIAPYRSVTESGSIHMALSIRVPVLAYESPGVAHIINAASTAPTRKEFGDLLAKYLDVPWQTYTPDAFDLHKRCITDWRRILNEAF